VGVAALVLLGAAVFLHLRQGLDVTDPARREPGE
jgi:hypothetical protein